MHRDPRRERATPEGNYAVIPASRHGIAKYSWDGSIRVDLTGGLPPPVETHVHRHQRHANQDLNMVGCSGPWGGDLWVEGPDERIAGFALG